MTEINPPSKTESRILSMLCENGEMYGLEMVRRSQGKLKRGTIYVTLSRMMDKGYVDSHQEEREIGPPKRIFILTKYGLVVYQELERAAKVIARAKPKRRLQPVQTKGATI